MAKQIEITGIPDELYLRLSRDINMMLYKSGIKEVEMRCIVDGTTEKDIGCEFACEP